MPKMKIVIACEVDIPYEHMDWLEHESKENPYSFMDELRWSELENGDGKIVTISLEKLIADKEN